MPRMKVLRVVVHAASRQPVLLLGEVDGGRCLPVFLRRPQADVIALGPRAESDPPLTQDLVASVAERLGHPLTGVEITELRDGAFRAVLVLGDTRLDARPSDALAVAVRDGLPITVADAILDEVGQPIEQIVPDGGPQPPERQLREFRQFIDQVSPEDFGQPPTDSSA
ncbi:MAG: bifunctional nuclease family protein [Pseudonocardia sp.]|jgi:uncharacterized protein